MIGRGDGSRIHGQWWARAWIVGVAFGALTAVSVECAPPGADDDGGSDGSQECDLPDPEPLFGDCQTFGFAACGEGPTGSICLVDDRTAPEHAVCSVIPCDSVCDCPAPPSSGEAEVECREEVTTSGRSGCILDCSDGKTCPNGMTCMDNGICFWELEPPEPPEPQPPYGDCLPQTKSCEYGECFLYSDDPPIASCAERCEDDGDCAAAIDGDITPTCRELDADNKICILECSELACPEGMTCLETVQDFSLCGWLAPGHEPAGDTGDGTDTGDTGTSGGTADTGDGTETDTETDTDTSG